VTTAVGRVNWRRDELLVVFRLYCELPFGKMHSTNPEVLRISKATGRTPSAVAMKLTNIASLDPAIRLSGRKGLTGASRADKQMWAEMISDWATFSLNAEAASIRLGAGKTLETELASSEVADDYVGLTRSVTVAARIGQSLFRKSVLSAYNYRCCISGANVRKLLVASHIVPWKYDSQNRLNPRNGLCLSAMHDRAFDAGLISLAEDHTLILSKQVRATNNEFIKYSFLAYEGKKIVLPEKFPPEPDFLSYHRLQVFKR